MKDAKRYAHTCDKLKQNHFIESKCYYCRNCVSKMALGYGGSVCLCSQLFACVHELLVCVCDTEKNPNRIWLDVNFVNMKILIKINDI